MLNEKQLIDWAVTFIYTLLSKFVLWKCFPEGELNLNDLAEMLKLSLT